MVTSVQLFTLGCDTTSKIGTKRTAYQAAIDTGYGLLHSFGKEMVCNAERFLIYCIAEKCGVSKFDDLL